MVRCTALTKTGHLCKKVALRNNTKCSLHQTKTVRKLIFGFQWIKEDRKDEGEEYPIELAYSMYTSWELMDDVIFTKTKKDLLWKQAYFETSPKYKNLVLLIVPVKPQFISPPAKMLQMMADDIGEAADDTYLEGESGDYHGGALYLRTLSFYSSPK